jgi:PAS domain S-box-containing protein
VPFLCRFFLAFAFFQILADFLVETILIYLTGGIFSVFTPLYFVSIVLSGMLISPNNSLVFASVATIGLSGIALIYFLAVEQNVSLPFLPRENVYLFLITFDLPFCKSYLFAQGVAFHLVAFLSGRLANTISDEKILQKEILENLSDGVLVTNSKNRVIFINNVAKNMLGFPNSMVVEGILLEKILDSNKYKSVLEMIHNQQPCSFFSQIEQNNSVIPVQFSISVIKHHKKARAVIAILRNISQQKRMEEAIQHANRSALLSEIAAMIAHEIRNPLASIRGAVQELQRVVPPADPSFILTTITIRESDRIARIITHFLEFAKIRPPVFNQCCVSEILEEVILLLNKRENKAIIQKNIQPSLVIHADNEHLKQVFYNLGINAIEAIDQKSIPEKTNIVCITAQKKRRDEFDPASLFVFSGVEICFHDQGRGMSPEVMEKIFTPFFTTKEQGTGMGLALVKRILEFHKALYRIETEQGMGTKFYLWFPSSEIIMS